MALCALLVQSALLRSCSWLVLSFLAIAGGCRTTAPTPVNPDIARLRGLKQEAEDWGSHIKADFPAGSPERTKAEGLYISARSSVESWLIQVKFDLNAGRGQLSSEASEKLLAETARRAQDFID